MRLSRLTCNQLDRPLGIDSDTLRFGWVLLAGPGESAVQTAYRLRVRDEDGGLVFDSGRTEARESQQIVLRIPGLLPSSCISPPSASMSCGSTAHARRAVPSPRRAPICAASGAPSR